MKSAANKLPNDPQVLQQMLLAAMAREADLTAKTDALASAVERHAARAEWLQSVTEDRSLQIQRLESRSQAQDQQIAHLESVVAHKEARIEQLELLTRLMRQRQFGPRADQSPQQDLLWEEVETLQADLEQVDRNQGLTPQVTTPHGPGSPPGAFGSGVVCGGACVSVLYLLWIDDATHRRRCVGSLGCGTDAVSGDPLGTPKVCLQWLSDDRPSACTGSGD